MRPNFSKKFIQSSNQILRQTVARVKEKFDYLKKRIWPIEFNFKFFKENFLMQLCT